MSSGLFRLRAGACVAALFLTFAGIGHADEPDSDTSSASEAVPKWRLRILQLETIARFNYMDREDGFVTDRGLEYRMRARARLDLLESGTTYVTVRAETGKGFDNSWNTTGVGLGTRQWIFNVKTLSLHQRIGSHLEVEAGGIEFDPGAGSDSTYASGDGPMTGYRLLMTKRAGWQPDKFSITAGYVGDFDKPNLFSRFRMNRVNYVQALAQQRFTSHLQGSAEYDAIRGVSFSRTALRGRKMGVLDEAVIEEVTRMSEGPSFGWGAMAGHKWGTHWATSLLYTQIPDRLYVIRGERALYTRGEIATGKRLSSGINYHLTRDVDLGVFGGRLLDSTPSKRWVAQFFLGVQYADLVNRLLR